MKNLLGLGVISSAAFYSAISSAAVDISTDIAALTTDGTAAITAVGSAMIGLAVVAVVFKWAKAAIFG